MGNKLKIAFVAGWPPEDKQGEANYAANIVNEYKLMYPESEIIVYAHVLEEKNIDGVIDCMNGVKLRRVTNGSNVLIRTFRSFLLSYYILKDKCNIVHYQGVHTPIYGLLFGESMLFTFFFLKILSIKQFYSLHSTWMKDDLVSLMKEKKKGKILTNFFVLYYGFYLRCVNRIMNKLLIVSCGNKSFAVDEFVIEWGLNKTNIFKENHPCHKYLEDKKSINNLLSINLKPDANVVLCLGYVRRDKGIHNLINAFESIANEDESLQLIIGGETIGEDGSKYSLELKNQISNSKYKDRINYFSQYIDQDLFQYLFSISKVVVVPYLRVIGPSGPIHYALGRSKIVVASNLGHNCNLEGVISLYDNNAIDSLISNLDKVLNDKEFVKKINSEIEIYKNDNSWENMSNNYHKFYNE